MKSLTENFLVDIAKKLVVESSVKVSGDVMEILEKRLYDERNQAAKRLLETMIENVKMATAENKPLCQSPGYPVVYVTVGSNFRLEADLQKIFSRVIVELTRKGYLRPSMVHPITRKNPGDNSGVGIPDVEVEYNHEADFVDLIISFKGCGAELANKFKVLTPAQVGEEGIGIKRFVVEAVAEGGAIPCPPSAIGVGIGGQLHYAAKLSRKVVSVRKWTDISSDPEIAALEKELLEYINSLGIGPGGAGGDTTALTVKVGLVSTHTAICPVAVNFHCWTGRKRGIRIHADKSIEDLF